MAEAIEYKFRTAVGGFHRGDVTAYISRTASEHKQEVANLTRELEELRRENEELRARLDARPLPQEPETEEAAPAEALPEAPDAEVPAAEEAAEAIPDPEEAAQADLREQELEAYRRAEAAERLAFHRARRMYEDMQGICDRSAAQLDASDSLARDAVDQINAQLDAIRDSVSALSGVLRSSSEELRTMGQMLPDPAEGTEED